MITQQYTPGQQEFLQIAEKEDIKASVFGDIIPDIKYKTENFDNSKPTIAYLHTGGTLMMVPSKNDENRLSFDGAIDIPKVIEICNYICNLEDKMNVIGIYVSNIDSKDVISKFWPIFANTIKSIYNIVDGTVVGHGTHTLDYSSTAMAYALQRLANPIVFTASQIPILGHLGSDGLPNLTGAMDIAANGNIAEVLVYFNGKILRATRASKVDDARLDGFDSKVIHPIGYYTGAGIEIFPNSSIPRGRNRKYELSFSPHFSNSVSSIKINPSTHNNSIREIKEASQNDVGFILETYGSGAVPKNIAPSLEECIKADFPIFLSSSCGNSGISNSMQNHDDDAKMISDLGIPNVGDMSTTAAVVKLMHIVGNNPGAPLKLIVDEMLKKSYAGEITVSRENTFRF
ncbi:MAG: asparaginase [Candidatus Gracilibacteria bacterium]|nr:asparaginase [Candidatus Gracilibacteria bacterium]